MHILKAVPLTLLVAVTCIDSSLAFAHHGHNRNEVLHLERSLSKAIEVTGKHAFKPPTKGQQRGPCPGLNALANHNYISRDGIVSLLEAINAITTVYGMGVDLATILAVLGAVWAGDPVSLNPSFSIGGPDARVQNIAGGLLGLTGE
jgi:hypothetical protein